MSNAVSIVIFLCLEAAFLIFSKIYKIEQINSKKHVLLFCNIKLSSIHGCVDPTVIDDAIIVSLVLAGNTDDDNDDVDDGIE